MNVVIWRKKRFHKKYVDSLRRFLVSRGHRVSVVIGGTPPISDALFIWNGHLKGQQRIAKRFKANGSRVVYFETAVLPQANHYFVSNTPCIGGGLLRDDSIPALTGDDELYLQNFFFDYSRGASMDGPQSQISGFLQLPYDYAFKRYSKYCVNQEVIFDADQMFPDEKVVWKVHPKDRKVRIKCREPLYRGASIWPHISKAKKCIAVNSTALFEAALAGREVIALGQSPLSRPEGPRAVVRECLRRQIHVDSKDALSQFERSIGEVF